jgi:hypothetical protein
MPTLGNTPKTQTILRLAARKSYSLALFLVDRNEKPFNLSTATITLVAKREPLDPTDDDDGDNLIVNSTADIVFAEGGYARFNLQASDLDHEPGEYPFTMTIIDGGYSFPLAAGPLEIVENSEFASSDEVYDPDLGEFASSLQVTLQNRQVLKIITGPTLAPGTVGFTDADKDKLDSLLVEAQLPPDGVAGEVLMKVTDTDYDVDWGVVDEDGVVDMIEDPDDPGFFIPDDETVGLEDDPDDEGTFILGTGSLDATDVPAGRVPVALGNDYWSWDEIETTVSSLDDVADSDTRLAMTPEERAQLALVPTTFGTAAMEDVEAFEPAGANIDAARITTGVIDDDRIPLVSALRGWTHGTAAPSGPPGTIYLKHS